MERLKPDEELLSITQAQLRILAPCEAVYPFQDSTMGPFHSFGISMITLTDEDGFTGEAPIHSGYINIFEKSLLPILFQYQKTSYKDIYYKMYWSVRNEGFRGQAASVLGQIDIALHDLISQRHKMPLHRYLGAERDEVNMYGSGGGTNYSMDEIEKEFSFFLDRGVDCIKMKVGKDFGSRMDEDVQRVRQIRKTFGTGFRLALDANQIWDTPQAAEFSKRVEEYHIEWFEEPVHSAGITEIRKLCSQSPLKISYGESERTSKVFPSLAEAGVQHFQPIPTQFSGMAEWLEVKELAIKNHIDFSAGGYSWFSTSFIATAPENCMVEYLHSLLSGIEVYFEISPKWAGNKFIIPDVHGVPVKINWEYCRKENKIVEDRLWKRQITDRYLPTVSL